MSEKKKFFAVLLAFLVLYFLPVENGLFQSAVINAFKLLHEYSTKHVLTCLVPAFFIAGAIAVFVNKGAILQYLGPKAKPYIAYPIAATSGAVLAVCSCTILPLFAGIYKRGAGLGPAIAFLYSGPAINVAAIFLTASVLGFKIGFARALASIAMSIAVGFTMALLFREKKEQGKFILEDKKQKISRSLLFTFFFSLVGLLVVNGLQIENTLKLATMSLLVLLVAFIASVKFKPETRNSWLLETWNISKLLLPYLFVGIFIIGFIEPLIPESFVVGFVGSNTILANLISSIFGTFMYFSTLTEVPLMQTLLAKGMHQGPALALLLSGPSLSLPAILVIRQVLGNKRTIAYVLLVIFYSSVAGLIFGMF